MEDQNQQNADPLHAPQQPQSPTSGNSYIVNNSSQKVIQPSAELVQEVKAEQTERAAAQAAQAAAQSTAQPVPVMPATNEATVNTLVAPQQATTAAPSPQPTRPDPSSIYPEATKGISSNSGRSPSLPQDETYAKPETFTFPEGYTIGSTVFWYQLIAGFVFGGVTGFLLRGYHTPLILAITTVIDYLILTYLSYRVMKSYAVGEPLWIAPIGMASQTVIVGIAGAFVLTIEKAMGISLGAAEPFIDTIIGLAFLVATYFLTRLSWGLAFSIYGTVKNKVVVKVLAIGIVAVFVGSLAYHFVTQQKTISTANKIAAVGAKNQAPDPAPTAYAKKTFKGHGFQVTLMFDPNARSRTMYTPNKTTPSGTVIPGDNEVDIIGNLLASSNQVNVGVVDDYGSPELPDAQSMKIRGTVAAFNATIMGKQYTVYESTIPSFELSTYVQVGQTWYELGIQPFGEPQGFTVSQATAEAILSSISIQ